MGNVPRIAIDLPDDLHRQIKAAAALAGMSLKAYVIELLEDATAGNPAGPSKRKGR